MTAKQVSFNTSEKNIMNNLREYTEFLDRLYSDAKCKESLPKILLGAEKHIGLSKEFMCQLFGISMKDYLEYKGGVESPSLYFSKILASRLKKIAQQRLKQEEFNICFKKLQEKAPNIDWNNCNIDSDESYYYNGTPTFFGSYKDKQTPNSKFKAEVRFGWIENGVIPDEVFVQVKYHECLQSQSPRSISSQTPTEALSLEEENLNDLIEEKVKEIQEYIPSARGIK